jgi:hypothetical protein
VLMKSETGRFGVSVGISTGLGMRDRASVLRILSLETPKVHAMDPRTRRLPDRASTRAARSGDH